jgi:hypothetical protein
VDEAVDAVLGDFGQPRRNTIDDRSSKAIGDISKESNKFLEAPRERYDHGSERIGCAESGQRDESHCRHGRSRSAERHREDFRHNEHRKHFRFFFIVCCCLFLCAFVCFCVLVYAFVCFCTLLCTFV